MNGLLRFTIQLMWIYCEYIMSARQTLSKLALFSLKQDTLVPY